ncbi:hypothetical protein ACYUJ6_05700 [Clostridium sp. JNZ X4-2]
MINLVSNVISKNNIMNIHGKKNNKLADLNKNLQNRNAFSSDYFKIDQLRCQLRNSQIAEQHIQQGVSILQEKNKAVNDLRSMSKELKQLSIKYNSADCTIEDKQAMEKRAKDIIDSMNNIMNTSFGDKSIFAGQQVRVETSHGSNIIVDSGLHISIDLDMNKSDKNKKNDYNCIHIEGNLSIESILKGTNDIEDNLIKPLDKCSDEIRKQMVSLVNDAMYQDMILVMAAKGLSSLGDIDEYEETAIINNSSIILESAAEALYSQSSNLDKDRVAQLIK